MGLLSCFIELERHTWHIVRFLEEYDKNEVF